MKRKIAKVLSLILALSMSVSSMPLASMADEVASESAEPVELSEEQAEAVEESTETPALENIEIEEIEETPAEEAESEAVEIEEESVSEPQLNDSVEISDTTLPAVYVGRNTISVNSDFTYYSFTPDADSMYKIYTVSELDTYATLDCVAYDNYENDKNFCIENYFSAYNTYEIGICAIDATETSEITLIIQKIACPHDSGLTYTDFSVDEDNAYFYLECALCHTLLSDKITLPLSDFNVYAPSATCCTKAYTEYTYDSYEYTYGDSTYGIHIYEKFVDENSAFNPENHYNVLPQNFILNYEDGSATYELYCTGCGTILKTVSLTSDDYTVYENSDLEDCHDYYIKPEAPCGFENYPFTLKDRDKCEHSYERYNAYIDGDNLVLVYKCLDCTNLTEKRFTAADYYDSDRSLESSTCCEKSYDYYYGVPDETLPDGNTYFEECIYTSDDVNPNNHTYLCSKDFSIDESGNLHFTVYCENCGTEEYDDDGYYVRTTPSYTEDVTVASGDYYIEHFAADCVNPAHDYIKNYDGYYDDDDNYIEYPAVILSNDQEYRFSEDINKTGEKDLGNHTGLCSKDFSIDENEDLHFTVYCESCATPNWDDEGNYIGSTPVYEEEVTVSSGKYYSEYCAADCVNPAHWYVANDSQNYDEDDGIWYYDYPAVELKKIDQEYRFCGDFNIGDKTDSNNHAELSGEYSINDGNLVFSGYCEYCEKEVTNEVSAQEISAGSKSIDITGEYTFFKFTADKDHEYYFYTESDVDTVGMLVASGKDNCEDDQSGNNDNFKIAAELNKDEVCYVGVKLYGGGQETVTLHITDENICDDHSYASKDYTINDDNSLTFTVYCEHCDFSEEVTVASGDYYIEHFAADCGIPEHDYISNCGGYYDDEDNYIEYPAVILSNGQEYRRFGENINESGEKDSGNHTGLCSKDFSIDESGNLHFTVYCENCGTEEYDDDGYYVRTTPSYTEYVTVSSGNYCLEHYDADCVNPAHDYISNYGGYWYDEGNYIEYPAVKLTTGQEYRFYEDINKIGEKDPDNHAGFSGEYSIDEAENLVVSGYCGFCGKEVTNEVAAQEISAGSTSIDITGEYTFFKFKAEKDHEYYIYTTGFDDYDTYGCLVRNDSYLEDDDSGFDCYFKITSELSEGEVCYIGVKLYSGSEATVTLHITDENICDEHSLASKDFTIDESGNLTFTVYCENCDFSDEFTLSADEYAAEHYEATCISGAYTEVTNDNDYYGPLQLPNGEYYYFYGRIYDDGSEPDSDNHRLESKDYYIDGDGTLHFTVYCYECGEWDDDNYNPSYYVEEVINSGDYEAEHYEATCCSRGYTSVSCLLTINGESHYFCGRVYDEDTDYNPYNHEYLEAKDFSIDESGNLHFIVYCDDCAYSDDYGSLVYEYYEEKTVKDGGYYASHVDATCTRAGYTYVSCDLTINGREYYFGGNVYDEDGSLKPDNHGNLRTEDFSVDEAGNLHFTVRCYECGHDAEEEEGSSDFQFEEKVDVSKGSYTVYESSPTEGNCGWLHYFGSVSLSNGQNYSYDEAVAANGELNPDCHAYFPVYPGVSQLYAPVTLDADGNLSFTVLCFYCSEGYEGEWTKVVTEEVTVSPDDYVIVSEYDDYKFIRVQYTDSKGYKHVGSVQYFENQETITEHTEHTWDNGQETQAATAESAGTYTYTCTVCGLTKTEIIPMLDSVYAKVADVNENTDSDTVNDVVNTLISNDASVIAENIEMDDLANLEETYVANNEQIAETSVSENNTQTVTAVEGAALTAGKYIADGDTESKYSAELEVIGYTPADGETISTELQEALNDEDSLVIDINLNIVKDGSVVESGVQPEAPVRITMKVPEKFSGSDFILYHYKSNGDVEKIDYERVGDEIVFIITSLSPYELKPHEHVYGTPVVTKAATCTETGIQTSTCDCGATKIDIIPTTAHDYDDGVDKTAATCKYSEIKVYTCKTCGATRTVAGTTDPSVHNVVDVAAVAATCTKDGTTAGKKCIDCGAILEGIETVPAAGHKNAAAVKENEVAPTCTAQGSYDEVVYCSVCHEKISSAHTTVAAKDHTIVNDAAVAATCTSAGKTAGTHCSVCNTVLTAQQSIAAKGHTVVNDAAVAATCTSAGKTAGTHCSVCNAVLTAQQTVAAKGHTAAAAVKENEVAATYSAEGSYDEVVYCSVCHEKLSSTHKTVAVKALAKTTVTLSNVAKGIKISWKKVTGATGYKIYRGTKLIKTITKASTVTYTDTAVKSKNGTKYTYYVVAYAKNVSTNKSTSAKVTTYRLTAVSVKTAKNTASKQVTVTYGKNSKASGYQIRYVTGSKTKTVSVTKAATVKKVLTKLTKGKTYKVSVRAYKKVSGKTYYSAWSSAKSVKIKK